MRRLLYACFALLLFMGAPRAEEVTDAQVQQWIKELSDDDFQKRENAQAKLLTAGAKALEPLKKALDNADAETKARGQKIVDELGWTVRGDLKDQALLFPDNAFFLIKTPNLKDAVAKIRKETALGKLYDNPEFAPFRNTLGDVFQHETRMPDKVSELIVGWLDHFGGPAAFGAAKPLGGERRSQPVIGLALGLNGDPAKDFDAFTDLWPVRNNPQKERYRGAEFMASNEQWSHDSLGRFGRTLVRSSGGEEFRSLVDQVLADGKGALANDALYKDGLAKTNGTNAHFTLFFSFQRLLEDLANDQPSPREMKLFEALGWPKWKLAAVALDVKDGLFDERAVLEGEPKGLLKVLAFPKSTQKFASLAPAGAIAFISFSLDGKTLWPAIAEYLDAEMGNRGGEEEGGAIKAMEKQLGFVVADAVAARLQGEAAFWISRADGGEPDALPDICGAFDAKEAAVLSETLTKVIKTPERLGKSEYKGKTIYTLKEGKHPGVYEWSWCADGEKLYLGSSEKALQKTIDRAATPGGRLDANADYKHLVELIPAEERGGIVYINSPEGLKWVADSTLPMLLDHAPAEVKEKLSLQHASALLKDLPGTITAFSGTPGAVRIHGTGGIPVTLSLPVGMFSLFAFERSAMVRAPRAMPVPMVAVPVEKKAEAAPNKDEPKKEAPKPVEATPKVSEPAKTDAPKEAPQK